MAEPVRARRLTDQEGSRLLQIVRRGKHGSIRARRAMIIMASASGTPVPAIAQLVAADEDTVRDVVHLFNQKRLAALDPRWAGGRARLISDVDVQVIVEAATTRPEKGGYRLFVILDNLLANKTPVIRRWAAKPTSSVLHVDKRLVGQPDRGAIRADPQLAIGASDHPATPSWSASCRTTCAGAMPTPATPTSWPPPAANAPASAASASNAGDGPRPWPHRQQQEEKVRAGLRVFPRHGPQPGLGIGVPSPQQDAIDDGLDEHRLIGIAGPPVKTAIPRDDQLGDEPAIALPGELGFIDAAARPAAVQEQPVILDEGAPLIVHVSSMSRAR
jgi:transposase